MRDVVIASGARTAIGDYMGSLSGLTPVQMGIIALDGAISKFPGRSRMSGRS